MVRTASYEPYVPDRGLDAAIAKAAGNKGVTEVLPSSWCHVSWHGSTNYS